MLLYAVPPCCTDFSNPWSMFSLSAHPCSSPCRPKSGSNVSNMPDVTNKTRRHVELAMRLRTRLGRMVLLPPPDRCCCTDLSIAYVWCSKVAGTLAARLSVVEVSLVPAAAWSRAAVPGAPCMGTAAPMLRLIAPPFVRVSNLRAPSGSGSSLASSGWDSCVQGSLLRDTARQPGSWRTRASTIPAAWARSGTATWQPSLVVNPMALATWRAASMSASSPGTACPSPTGGAPGLMSRPMTR